MLCLLSALLSQYADPLGRDVPLTSPAPGAGLTGDAAGHAFEFIDEVAGVIDDADAISSYWRTKVLGFDEEPFPVRLMKRMSNIPARLTTPLAAPPMAA